MQGDSAIFVGDPPTNCEDYFRNYCLYLGVSASNWALTKRKSKGAGFLQYVPTEDKLPYVVGYVFSTAAGRTGLISEDKGEAVDAGIDAAVKLMRKFLEDGRGRVVKEQAETEVRPEELKDADFGDLDPWRMDRMMTKIKKESQTSGGRRGAGEECPMQ
ncbi:hypothetical protein AUP68_08674 [Ilyonectria robusta]